MSNMTTTLELVPSVLLTYILELENNKYYVGVSSNLNIRFGSHWTGQGAKWTRKHKPLRIFKVALGNREKEFTLKMMKDHGWQNVRGYSWCQVELKAPPVCLRPCPGVIS